MEKLNQNKGLDKGKRALLGGLGATALLAAGTGIFNTFSKRKEKILSLGEALKVEDRKVQILIDHHKYVEKVAEYTRADKSQAEITEIMHSKYGVEEKTVFFPNNVKARIWVKVSDYK